MKANLLCLISHLTFFYNVGADGSLRGSRNATVATNPHIKPLQQQNEGVVMVQRRMASNERKVYHPTSKPWTAVGKVETATSTCTGVLVSERLVITAQCCLNWLEDGSLDWMRFTPAYYDGNAPFGSAMVTNTWWSQKVSCGSSLTNYQTAFNYAILLLDGALGNAAGYWCFKHFDKDWIGKKSFRRIGYANDVYRGERPFYSENAFSITSFEEHGDANLPKSCYMPTSINAVNDRPGSPLYGTWDDQPCVVGLINAHATSTGLGIAAGGAALGTMIQVYKQEDDRKVFHPTSKPWTAVGKVETERGVTLGDSNAACTGVLVGPRLMLTSFCCAYDAIINKSWLRFAPAYFNGNAPFGTAMATHFWWDKKLPKPFAATTEEAAFNYVVVLLDRRLGDSAGYWCFRQFDPLWIGKSLWRRIGYSVDMYNKERPFRTEHTHSILTIAEEFTNSATGSKSYIMLTTMSKGHNKTGDPLFGLWGNNEPCVIGLVNSFYLLDNSTATAVSAAAGGPALENLITKHLND